MGLRELASLFSVMVPASRSAITFPSGPTSSLNAGVDDTGLVSATAAQTSAPQSQPYLATSPVASLLTLTDNFGNPFDFGGAFDVDANTVRVAGSVFDGSVGTFGKNYPALWQLNTGAYQLRRFNGLTASTTWTIGRLTAINPAGTFAAGFGGSPDQGLVGAHR